MNALEKAIRKVDAEIDRIILKLDDLESYNYQRSSYRYDAYTRQGGQALAQMLRQAGDTAQDLQPRADGSFISFNTAQLDRIAEMWNQREDWRTAAFAANVAKAVERLVGLS